MKHTLVALVEDKPGVLNRVASLFRRRAFNIESLTVGHTHTPGISRMTIVIDSTQTNAERVTANLYKLINVIQVDDLAEMPSVSRDLAIIKVSANVANRGELIQLVDVFRARIVDVGSESLIVEITGVEEKIDGFVDVLRPFGIIEMVRTGIVAMARGSDPYPNLPSNGNGSVAVKELATLVDLV
ncbi:MAG: acetolactate synthase small subunit [Chloroflexi bacterium]|nr:acetolactate synthase small subunit [Chloroflexota bacterium]